MSPLNPQSREQLRYITKIFPILDVPFMALSVIYSDNWIVTLCLVPFFGLNAGISLWLSDKYKFQPGYAIWTLNGTLYFIFQFISGPDAPGWLMLINITIGSCFMVNNVRLAQVIVLVMSIATALEYYLLGASMMYSCVIGMSLMAFTVLFGRTYDYIRIQSRNIESKSKELESKNKDITDSINYAKRIQYAVLPLEESIYRSIPLCFIVYKPRDIVSGDFFWFHEIDRDNYIIVCADCTGHGVPGALMTVIGSNLLNQIIMESKIHSPAQILKELDLRISATLKQQKQKDDVVHDGMDLALLKVNKATSEFTYTSAKRPAIFLRDKQLSEFKGSKHTLGGFRSEEKSFDEITRKYQEDDVIYLFTDGYIDQFGGPENKKFMIRRFRDLLVNIHSKPIAEQKTKVESAINEWIGANEQTDDIAVIGIRF